jgi:predicted membrane-bound mannosyltransferase
MKMVRGIIKINRSYLDLAVVTILSLIPRLFGIQRFLWVDELISIRTLEVNILHNPLLFGTTTNLPLFFYTLKLFSLFYNPSNLWLYRIVPVFFGTAVILILFIFLKKELGKKIAWFTAFIWLYPSSGILPQN